jgi:uncharacterized protein (TIGR03118 family)
MRHRRLVVASVLAMSIVGLPQLARAQLEHSQFYEQHNIASDDLKKIPADHVDFDLVNPWGLAASATSPWWIANNGTNRSTIYNGNTGVKAGLVVKVPGAPTGIVSYSGSGFIVGGSAARFIFAGEDGVISGWPGSGTTVSVGYSNAAASYKGLAINLERLYATNFAAGTVDVFNNMFAKLPAPGFVDPTIPAGYAPFGIQNVGGTIIVTYALRGPDGDDVAGPGHGFVNAFDPNGNLLYRVASRGSLNSPWGIAMAPLEGFGRFSGDLLIGNFGDGRIHAYEPSAVGSGEFEDLGPLHSASGPPIQIDGLWAIQFGNGGNAGPRTTLFFTAGPFEEEHGLFGRITLTDTPGHNKQNDK